MNKEEAIEILDDDDEQVQAQCKAKDKKTLDIFFAAKNRENGGSCTSEEYYKSIQPLFRKHPSLASAIYTDSTGMKGCVLGFFLKSDSKVLKDIIGFWPSELIDPSKKDDGFYQDNLGRNLIHQAIACNATNRVITLLVRKLPFLAKERDEKHDLPLHYLWGSSFDHKQHITAIKALVEANPEALWELHDEDSRDLILKAFESNMDSTILKLMMDKLPDYFSLRKPTMRFHGGLDFLDTPEGRAATNQFLAKMGGIELCQPYTRPYKQAEMCKIVRAILASEVPEIWLRDIPTRCMSWVHLSETLEHGIENNTACKTFFLEVTRVSSTSNDVPRERNVPSVNDSAEFLERIERGLSRGMPKLNTLALSGLNLSTPDRMLNLIANGTAPQTFPFPSGDLYESLFGS